MKRRWNERPLTPKQRQGIAWYWLKTNSNLLTSDIAEDAGVSQRTVQFRIKRARDWLEARGYGSIALIMNGFVGRCRHGVEITAKGTALCIDCLKTNNPNHPAFRKGRQEERKPPPKSKLEIESPGTIVYELAATAQSARQLEQSTKPTTPKTPQLPNSKKPNSAS